MKISLAKKSSSVIIPTVSSPPWRLRLGQENGLSPVRRIDRMVSNVNKLLITAGLRFISLKNNRKIEDIQSTQACG